MWCFMAFYFEKYFHSIDEIWAYWWMANIVFDIC